MSNDHEFYAHGIDKAEIETVMRFHAVKRWHMIDTTRQQTLAEHSGNVALLIYLISSRAPGQFFGPSYMLTGAALVHDLPEVFTGDFPTMSKRHLQGVQELEDQVLPPVFVYPLAFLDTSQKLLLKMCDLADGIRFIRIHGVDTTAKHAMEGLQDQLQMKWIQVSSIWPENIIEFVSEMITFYAYENK